MADDGITAGFSESLSGLRRDLRANRVGWYLADLVHHLLNEHDPHPVTFDALDATLRGLEDPSAAALHLLLFQWRLLDDVGYRPEVDRDAETGAAKDFISGYSNDTVPNLWPDRNTA